MFCDPCSHAMPRFPCLVISAKFHEAVAGGALFRSPQSRLGGSRGMKFDPEVKKKKKGREKSGSECLGGRPRNKYDAQTPVTRAIVGNSHSISVLNKHT